VLDRELGRLTLEAAPALCGLTGVGPDVAGALLVAAGDNPERLRSDAAFASLCGVSPVPASSGKTNRHRLNRGGDRIANNALWRIVMVRLTCDQRPIVALTKRESQPESAGRTANSSALPHATSPCRWSPRIASSFASIHGVGSGQRSRRQSSVSPAGGTSGIPLSMR
jgi:transposase